MSSIFLLGNSSRNKSVQNAGYKQGEELYRYGFIHGWMLSNLACTFAVHIAIVHRCNYVCSLKRKNVFQEAVMSTMAALQSW